MKMYMVKQVHWLVPCCQLHGSPGEVPPAVTTASTLTRDPRSPRHDRAHTGQCGFFPQSLGSLCNTTELQAIFCSWTVFSWPTCISSCSMCCQMKGLGRRISECQAIHVEKPLACRKGKKGSRSAWKL